MCGPYGVNARGCSRRDRKSTRLNSSHGYITYAVFCLNKKKRAGQRKVCLFGLRATLACESVTSPPHGHSEREGPRPERRQLKNCTDCVYLSEAFMHLP